MSNSMLTLVGADCLRCGSNAEAVQRDREVLNVSNAVCCEIGDLARSDPREPYADYGDLLEPEVACFVCSALTRSPLHSGGGQAFCGKGCWSEYAE